MNNIEHQIRILIRKMINQYNLYNHGKYNLYMLSANYTQYDLMQMRKDVVKWKQYCDKGQYWYNYMGRREMKIHNYFQKINSILKKNI